MVPHGSAMSFRSLHRAGCVVAALAATILLATCKGSTEPSSVPTTIAVSPGTATLTAIGLSQQFSALVFDQKHDTMKTATVTWSTSAGSVVAVTATGLGTAVSNGTAQVIATSGNAQGQASVTVAQAVAQLNKTSGDLQAGTVGQALASPVVIQVNDATGHAAAGVTVSFAPTTGSGSVLPTSATTNAGGQAQAAWTLGTIAGASRDTLAVQTGGYVTRFTATVNPGPAAQVTKTAGDFQKTAAGYAVAVRPAVAVKDQYGNGIAGVQVTFAPVAGSGSATGTTQVSGANGAAAVGSWKVGASGGIDTMTATASGSGLAGNPAVFTDTDYVPGAPANVAAYAGTNNQPGLVGYPVNVRPAVLVTDASNNPVPNAAVTFAVASGGGSATGGAATTNASGVAQVGSWTLGAAAGVNTMTATAGTAPPLTFADTGAAGEFTIQVKFYGPATPTATEQAAFTAAVTKWQSIIYRHFGPPSIVVDSGNDCGAGEPALTDTITDVLILATFTKIGGSGSTIAEAEPCFVTTGTGPGSGLPVMGLMLFDTTAIKSLSPAQLTAVVTHEMSHVLGFGTLWDLIDIPAPNPFPPVNCLQQPSTLPSPLADTYFSCVGGTSFAAAEFDSIGGTSYTGAGQTYGSAADIPPVENCANAPWTYPTCGAGTVNSHWRETVFGNELMVGFLPSNPQLSVVTIGTMQDLGYTVNYAGADAYVQTFTAPPVGGATRVFLGDDILHGPLWAVNRTTGRIRLVRRRQ